MARAKCRGCGSPPSSRSRPKYRCDRTKRPSRSPGRRTCASPPMRRSRTEGHTRTRPPIPCPASPRCDLPACRPACGRDAGRASAAGCPRYMLGPRSFAEGEIACRTSPCSHKRKRGAVSAPFRVVLLARISRADRDRRPDVHRRADHPDADRPPDDCRPDGCRRGCHPDDRQPASGRPDDRPDAARAACRRTG